MFIYCFDDGLKNRLIKNGFKLLNEYNNEAVFIMDKNLQFDFSKIDKTKFLFSNKLNF